MPSFGTRISTSISSERERGLEHAREELGRGDGALAALPAGDQLAVQREDHRGKVGGGIAVRDRAADRPAVPNLRVADLARGRRTRSGSAPGAAGDAATSLCLVRAPIAIASPSSRTYERSPMRPTSISSAGRARRSFIAGMQRMAPREQLGVLPLPEKLDRVVGVLGDDVVERRRDHALTSSIAFQTRSGVAGIPTSVTPRCESASTTALMTAGCGGDRARLPHALHAERVVRDSSRSGRSRTTAAPRPTGRGTSPSSSSGDWPRRRTRPPRRAPRRRPG